MEGSIQKYPSPDSQNHDAMEAFVELYYQVNGYITSSGKWFWTHGKDKQNRGYLDIDVLAINSEETLIVNVTSNLDDKIGLDKNGNFRDDKLERILLYFYKCKNYLEQTREYEWLIKGRIVKFVVVYSSAPKRRERRERVIRIAKENGISEIINVADMLKSVCEYLSKENLKIQNNILRSIQLLRKHGMIDI